MTEQRSLDRFHDDDFRQLADLALDDLQAFMKRNPRHGTLRERLICIALCQGAALHHVDGQNGVKDFDVWMFFVPGDGAPQYPPRRRGVGTFAGQRFQDSTGRIDFLGRTISAPRDVEPAAAMAAHLGRPTSGSAWHLAQKAAVLLWPPERRGEVVWPVQGQAVQQN